MNKVEQLEIEVDLLKARFRQAKFDLDEAQQRLAEAKCPFVVGDTVKETKREYYWIIDQIKIGYFGTHQMYGRRLKKDGTPYARKQHIYSTSINPIIKAEFPKK